MSIILSDDKKVDINQVDNICFLYSIYILQLNNKKLFVIKGYIFYQLILSAVMCKSAKCHVLVGIAQTADSYTLERRCLCICVTHFIYIIQIRIAYEQNCDESIGLVKTRG